MNGLSERPAALGSYYRQACGSLGRGKNEESPCADGQWRTPPDSSNAVRHPSTPISVRQRGEINRKFGPMQTTVRLYSAIAFGLALVLTGCATESFLNRIAPETVQEAKTDFDYLRHGQNDRLEARLDPSIDRNTLRAELIRMAALVPPQNPISVRTVGAHRVWDSRKGTDKSVVLEYEFPSKWLLVELVVHAKDGNSTVTSFWVESESESLESANRFTLKGKTTHQYAILSAALGVLASTAYAFVLCLRTTIKRRKWFWIILILLGVTKLSVNWTTGEISYHLVRILIPPAWLTPETYGPWTVSVSLPLGALLFIFVRKHLEKPEATPPITNDPHSETTDA